MRRALNPITLLLPLAGEVGPRRRRAAAAVLAILLLALAGNLAYTALRIGAGSDTIETVVNQYGQQLVMAAATALCALRCWTRAPDRPAWIALTVALALWGLGNAYWNIVLYHDETPPFPSPADAGWLAFYPAAYLCIGLHLRTAVRGLSASMWLDGLVGALAVAGLGTAFVVAPILSGLEGNTAEVIVNAANPVGDLLLASLVIGVMGLSSWRPGRSWMLLGAGFAVFAAADSVYLYRLAADAYEPGTVLDSLWLIGAAVMAVAAWQRPRPAVAVVFGGWRTLALPFLSGLASIGLLVAAGLRDVEPAAVWFTAASLLAAMTRTSLTVRELRVLAETRRQARTDELTGLPNRRWFDRRLHEAIEQAASAGRSLALLVIDLDHFKELNDTLGHHAGDRVLAQLERHVRPALRAGDDLARLGGDEFAALLLDASEAEMTAARIASALEQRFSVDGIELQIGASIGIALFPEHGQDPETLLQRADVAMYEAKTNRSGTEFYAPERDRHTRERLQLVGELRDAVVQDRLTLHFQPKLDLHVGRVTGVEALLRWPHPERGFIPPDEFIPLAEQTGVIGPLTELVLNSALRQAADWRARGLDLTMAVNVSATSLLDVGWTDSVLAALEHWRLPADRLVVEITEGVLMADPERSMTVLRRLADAGVRVSLDDFGTGYSSLSYLKQLPVGELKIDRSFVMEMGTDRADAAIVRTAVDLGRRLGIAVVAEGVEDAETLRRLTRYGADMAQGYYIARPLPAGELEAWLGAGGFVLAHDEHVEGARAVDALDAVELDVRGGRRP